MIDTKEAYKILGVKENAGRNEIERKFAVLLKKYRMSTDIDQENAKAEIERITQAYNILMGYEEDIPEEELNRKPNPLLKKIGVDEKKARNFLYYYKYHIIIGIIALAVVVSILKSCIMRVEPDLNVAFIGNFNFSSYTETLKEAIKKNIPEIKEVSVDGAILIPNMYGQYEYAMQMKAMVLFAAGDVDLYILDKENFEKFAKQGAFMSLDSLAETLGIDRTKNQDYILKPDGGTEESLFGVNVSNSRLFTDIEIMGDEKIAAIGVRVKHYDNAVRLLKKLLEQA